MELGVFDTPGQEWDEFVSRHTDLIFYQSAWSEILRKGFRGQPLYFFLRDGGEIVCGLPGVLLNFRVFKIFYASLPYGNLLGDRKHFPDFMKCLEEEFVRRGIHHVRITDSPMWENWDLKADFKWVQSICTLIDLRNMDEAALLKSYDHYVRRDIKRARKNGVLITRAESNEDFEHLYQLYLQAMERNRAPAKYPYTLVSALQEFIMDTGRGVLLMARMGDVPVAGILLIHSTSSTHAFLAGSDSRYLRFYPNKLLIHQALAETIFLGHPLFDFMGSDKDDKNLLRFKELWGGRPASVRTYTKDYDPFRCWMWDAMRSVMSGPVGSKFTRIFRKMTKR